ncbi:exodeoxyribonuclease VII large subunit [Ancylothrix sp. C2]|uniref:exodeoxyribonuclease VII large subunit n=1 Tax=Ancylothrix sp. D3o TaxID=2953691 RepID=UPI0021BB19E9|nr:exodeoxyribonuclease VII large subunit [Ancylothrix sp. D3o]MCT7948819.1 exodeoxyribonuclease VII large subunit [Ancylothrix sp. D3o]
MFSSSGNSSIPETAFSITAITSYIKNLLETNELLQLVWVVGEVSSLNPHRNGHLYFSLQDSQRGATLNCVVWNRQQSRLTHRPELGKKVVVLGSLQLYPQQGKYQLSALQVIDAGAGLQQMRLQQLRNRLEAEGLFDPTRKRPLPPHPQTIAVVTSPNGAAWGDIQRTLKQRYPGLRVLLSPATVQGEQAPASIVAAIKRIEKDGRAEVLILARGGGAVEDLASFNDERIIRAVAECKIPVITGLGHERDESLTDLVADICAHTPTAAAAKVVPNLAELYTAHRYRLQRLYDSVENKCEQKRNNLEQLRDRLVRGMQTRLNQETERCRYLGEKLSVLDPQAVLKRGYAVVQLDDGTIVRSIDSVKVGEEVTILLAGGRLRVKVI